MSNFAPTRNTYDAGSDRRWARNFLALDTYGVTLDGSKFPAGTVIPSGTHIGKPDATTKLCGPARAASRPPASSSTTTRCAPARSSSPSPAVAAPSIAATCPPVTTLPLSSR